MGSHRTVTVFGAYGHTGRFGVAELRTRGWTPILADRDATKLSALSNTHPGLDVCVASVDDPASLDRAVSGAAAVINCAGQILPVFTEIPLDQLDLAPASTNAPEPKSQGLDAAT